VKIIHSRFLTWAGVVTCPRCQTVFEIEDNDKPYTTHPVPTYGVTTSLGSQEDIFHCPSCDHEIPVRGRSVAADDD
jgi:uncharacterized C2H2 Zn-finger protein